MPLINSLHMNKKKDRILHVVDSLKVGGAERVVVGTINGLIEYEHLVVTLGGDEDVGFELNIDKDNIINLNCSSKISYLFSIFKLRMIIYRFSPVIIHSHLFWSTIISRLSVPLKIPLISTYHSMIYDATNKAQYIPSLLLLDRLTYRHKYHTIFVSKAISTSISAAVGIKNNKEVLYNFVSDEFYKCNCIENSVPPIKAISIGNYRIEKNYPYIINALSNFSKQDITLDIYGNGDYEYLQSIINKNKMDNVTLHHSVKDVAGKLESSNVFIMASTHEGFGISLAEAMAVGIHIIVSDIGVFREVTDNKAIYFDLTTPKSLEDVISKLVTSGEMSDNRQGLINISQRYSYNNFINSISRKYRDIISSSLYVAA